MKGRVVTERERERRRTIVKLWFTKKKKTVKKLNCLSLWTTQKAKTVVYC